MLARRALTIFAITSDIAKYFVILPALFMAAYPKLSAFDVIDLASPASAVLSTVIFNAIVIVLLTPLALRWVRHAPATAPALRRRRNLLVYALGGSILPLIGIKVVDFALAGLGLA